MSEPAVTIGPSPTALWDKVKDPDLTEGNKATKQYKGKGGFQGTSVDPMVRLHMLTELFGPQGLEYGHDGYHNRPTGGWGFVVTEDKCIPDGAPVEHVIRVQLWYPWNGKMRVVEGYGCTDLQQLDAAKKSFTDAQGNAAKQLGVAASVYMGKFDDDKYVKDVERKQRKEKAPPASDALKSLRADLKTFVADTGASDEVAKVNFTALSARFKTLAKEEQAEVVDAFKSAKAARGWT